MSAEVHTLPGVLRTDLEEPTPPAKCLQSALDANLTSVAIVGRSVTGELHVYGLSTDADTTIGLLMRGATNLATCEQVPAPEAEA